MLRYRVLKTLNDKEISFSLDTSDIDKKNIVEVEDFHDFINPNLSFEKENYKPEKVYKINFSFYKNTYGTDFTNAGFVLPTELKKNVFKKSLFLLEFYSNSSDKTIKFSTTLSTFPNRNSKKGCDSILQNNVITAFSTYSINDPLNELFYIYNYRLFSNFTEILLDSKGLKYTSMYVKAMFLNAKTGKVHYFINNPTNDPNVLSSGQFNENLYFQEIRFFENYTYGFYNNGILVDNIYFKEIVVK